jgi:collagen type I/II/III/V/XI/XXIV/XXVII alpha
VPLASQGSTGAVSSGPFIVGDTGLGSLVIASGGTVTSSDDGVIGNTSSASGSDVSLYGASSNWQVTGSLIVGDAGYGQLSVSQGATVTATTLDTGVTGESALTVSDSETRLTVTGNATVGDDGSASLSIFNDATVGVGGNLTIGSLGNASGAVFINGSGAKLLIAGELNIGTALGYGELTIGTGGFVSATAIAGNGQVVLEGGTLDPAVDLVGAGYPQGGNGGLGGLDGNDQGFILNESTVFSSAVKGGAVKLTVTGTIVGGGTWSENGTSQPNAGGPGLLQIGSGTTMEVVNAVLNAATTTFTDDLTQANTYTVNNSVIDVAFKDATGVLQLDDIAGFAGTVSAYTAGDQFVITTPGTTDILANLGVSNSTTLTFTDNGTAEAIMFASAVNASQLTIVNNNTIVACYVEGTLIETTAGPSPIETLQPGDHLVTADGSPEPIVWLGSRAVNCRSHPNPEAVWPVRVTAGAFGPGLPARDLWLSPDHAVFVNGVLVPVRLLVNGTSITQVKLDGVTYYHVELPRHAIIFAEGLPAESYLDLGDRADFSRQGETIRLFPDFAARSSPDAALAWETRGAARLVLTGEELAAAKRAVVGPAGKRIWA